MNSGTSGLSTFEPASGKGVLPTTYQGRESTRSAVDWGRLAMATVAGSVVSVAYGFAVYGHLLAKQFAEFPAVFRADRTATPSPVLLVGIVGGVAVVAYMYTKMRDQGLAAGARFGLAVGMFNALYGVMLTYVIAPITAVFALDWAVAGLVEWTLVTTAIAAVYRRREVSARESR